MVWTRGGIARCLMTMVLAWPAFSFAQAGPPMVTDDPGTPGDGHIEINIAAIAARTSDGSTYELPLVDVNYGVGDRLQLKLETPYEIDTVDGRRGGVGSGLVGVKWRFVDGGDEGWNVSTYPQIGFNYPGITSTRSRLAQRGVSYFVPIEVQRNVGRLEIGIDGGRWFRTDGDSWSAGIALGTQLTDGWEIMAELHDERLTAAARDELLINIGSRLKLSPHLNLLISAGRDVHNTIDRPADLLLYTGLQLTR